MVSSQPEQVVHKTLSQKTLSQKIGLVEWLKVKALSSSPSTEKKKSLLQQMMKRHLTKSNIHS
jgi:hypothetical protein